MGFNKTKHHSLYRDVSSIFHPGLVVTTISVRQVGKSFFLKEKKALIALGAILKVFFLKGGGVSFCVYVLSSRIFL